jgi:hypothetical protein
MLHENDRLPTIVSKAMHFGTAQRHKLNHRRTEFTFLPAPYTKCTMRVNPAMQALFDQYPHTDYAYSTDRCYDVCLQAFM